MFLFLFAVRPLALEVLMRTVIEKEGQESKRKRSRVKMIVSSEKRWLFARGKKIMMETHQLLKCGEAHTFNSHFG